jgi:hypothetical protein
MPIFGNRRSAVGSERHCDRSKGPSAHTLTFGWPGEPWSLDVSRLRTDTRRWRERRSKEIRTAIIAARRKTRPSTKG